MSGTGQTHLTPLDGLRALACLVVVASHLRDFALIDLGGMGYFGVMLFFSLSGFLMGFLYLERPFTAAQILDYAAARFARIAPIYLAVIVAAWLIHQHVWSGFIYAIDDRNLARHLLFSGDVSVFWSIPPEVQFYFVFVLLWGCWAIYRQTGDTVPLFVAGIAVFLTIVFGQYAPGTLVVSKIQFFVAGLLAAIARRRFDLAGLPKAAVTGGQVLALALFLFILLPAHAPFMATKGFEYYADLRLAILSGGITWLFAYETRFARFIFGNRPAVAIGAWSFSLYLLHAPILQLSALWLKPLLGPIPAGLIGVAVSLLASCVSYHLLEAPLRGTIRRRVGAFLARRTSIARWLDRRFVRPFLPREDAAQ